MFWVFLIMKYQLTQTAALRSELRAADENFENRVQSRTAESEGTLKNNKSFQGIIPIRANCKSIRNGTGDWERIESFIQRHSDAVFSHGLCPKCNEALYGDQRRRLERNVDMFSHPVFPLKSRKQPPFALIPDRLGCCFPCGEENSVSMWT